MVARCQVLNGSVGVIMSTEPGGKLVTDSLVRDAQQLIADEGVEQEQLDLLEPLTAEELAAQETLGMMRGLWPVREARAGGVAGHRGTEPAHGRFREIPQPVRA
jgi:hypothetical protein